MQSFAAIWTRAANRHGGEAGLHAKIAEHNHWHDTAPKSDDRWLAEFTKRVFQAGFSWKVVDTKWDGFEAAFWGFDISRCARMDLDDLEALTTDKRIIRNGGKIKSVIQNARMIKTMTSEAGTADTFIRGWPSEDYVGLLAYLNKQGSRLGPNTASYALRFSGVPAFILSKDVTAALIHANIIDKPATSKSALRAVQVAFNHWSQECGKDISFISRVLACSMDG